MFRARWRFVVYTLLSALFLSWPAEAHPPEIGRTSGIQGGGNRSLIFEPNLGQTDPQVKFVSRGAGYTVFLTPGDTVLSFTSPANPKAMLRMKLIGAKHGPLMTGVAELPAKVNYLVGNAPASWRTGIPTYAKVRYGSVYPGVDLVYYGNQRELEYDFVVAPGADPRAIKLAFDGPDALEVDAQGDLVLRLAGREVRLRKPVVYQEVDGTRKLVAGSFTIDRTNRVGFRVAAYDVTKPLVIDPALGYSTLLGGSGTDGANAVAVDASGNAYVAGQTESVDFVGRLNAFKGGTKTNGATDAFIAKIAPDGTVAWVTYLGGTDADAAYGVAVAPGCSANCNVFVTGATFSADLPVTAGAFRTKIAGGSDAFVAKLTPNGSGLVYSTFVGGGGSDIGHAVAVDGAGNAYVAGETRSSNFPFIAGPFASSKGKLDAFLVKLNASGSALVYSTYFGGNGDDVAYAVAVSCPFPTDPTRPCDAYVTGQTASSNLPTAAPSPAAPFDSSFNGSTDAFVAKMNTAGTGLASLTYSTYLGGSGDDAGLGIALLCQPSDPTTCNAFVTGQTASANFPIVPGSRTFGGARRGSTDAFVAQLGPTGSTLVYSLFVGGSGNETGYGIAVDASGHAFLTGQTDSADFPTTTLAAGAYNAALNGGTDAFVTKLKADGSGPLNSTYLGGAAADAGLGIAFVCISPTDCSAYVAGQTLSAGFPHTSGTFNASSLSDAFVAKLDMRANTATALTSSVNPSTLGQPVTFTATVTSPVGVAPTGTVSFKDGGSTVGAGSLGASGTATFTTSVLSVGSHPITAEYLGDADFNGSVSPGLTQTVKKPSTTTTITSHAPGPSVVGQAITVAWSVTVNPPGSGTPTGTVTVDDGTGATCAAAVAVGSCALTPLSAGTKTLTATYGGDATFDGSAASVSHVVNPRATATSIGLSPALWIQGQPTTVIVTVTDIDVGTKSSPAGTVGVSSSVLNDVFTPAAASCGLAPAASDRSSCTVTVTASISDALTIGIHTLTALYGPVVSPSVHKTSTGTLDATVISAPSVVGTNRTGASALSTSCSNTQRVYVVGTNLLSPPIVAFAPATGITVLGTGWDQFTQVWADVQVSSSAGLTGRFVTVTNPDFVAPDKGTATSATAIVEMTATVCPGGAAAGGVKSATVQVAAAPILGSLGSPPGGRSGTNVTISGSAFDATPANNVVKFGGTVPGSGVNGTVVAGSATSLTVSVPTGATDGLVSVTINNPNSASNSQVSNGLGFTVTDVKLSSVSPATAAPGPITLQLFGTKFRTGLALQFAGTGAGNLTVNSVTLDPATASVDPTTGLTFYTHATAALSASGTTGLLSVTATNPADGATSTLANTFQVAQPPQNSFTLLVNGSDPKLFLPSVDNVSLTLDATGKCTAKSVTPHAVPITATFQSSGGATPPSQVTFTLVSGTVTTLAGTASNETCALGAQNDFSFSGSFLNADDPASQQVVVAGGGVYQATLYSYDTGGRVTVQVSGIVGGQTVVATVVIPADSDNDGMADAWENDPLNAGALNSQVPDGDAQFAPDGLTNFEKYRGIFLGGPVNATTGNMTAFTRLAAGKRHLFVRGTGFLSDLFVQAQPGTCGTNIPSLTAQADPSLGPVTTISVTNTFGFPPFGTAVLAAGITVNRFNYTGLTPTSFTGVTGVTSFFQVSTSVYPLTSAPVRATRLDVQVGTSLAAGATTVPVPSTAGFPASGTAFLGGTSAFSYTGITPTSFTGVTGVTQAWNRGTPIFTATPVAGDFCPNFEVGPAFAALGPTAADSTIKPVEVHDVSNVVGPASMFPHRSQANPLLPTLAMYTVHYDAVNCGFDDCNHITRRGNRDWSFATLGFSTIGTRVATQVFKVAFDAYWRDKPYEHRENVPQCAPGVTSGTQCYMKAGDGTPMLAPITLVADGNDSGTRDSNKESIDANGLLLSDTWIPGSYDRQLSPLAPHNDGICVLLPIITDPRTVARCTAADAQNIFPAPDSRATRRQVVRYLIMHELSHALGVAHTTDSTDLPYQYTSDFFRDHFSATSGSASNVQINNKAP